MIKLEINNLTNKKGVLCLGFFDCVHMGHMELIKKGHELLQDVFVFTFSTDMSQILHSKNGYIYSFEERLLRLEDENVKGVVATPFDDKFMKTSRKEFLDELVNTLQITAVICGEDYRFGYKGEGDVKYLKEYFNLLGINVIAVEDVLFEGQKASTTLAKALLSSGDIERLNTLLTSEYMLVFKKVGGQYVFDDLDDRVKLPVGSYVGKYLASSGKYEKTQIVVKEVDGKIMYIANDIDILINECLILFENKISQN